MKYILYKILVIQPFNADDGPICSRFRQRQNNVLFVHKIRSKTHEHEHDHTNYTSPIESMPRFLSKHVFFRSITVFIKTNRFFVSVLQTNPISLSHYSQT